MTPEEHKARHVTLHQALDELLADYLRHHPESRMTTTSLLDLIRWSHEQTQNPTELTRGN